MGTSGAVGQLEDLVEQEESGQGRSTIKFTYLDQDDAVAVAKGVHAAGGTSCQRDQLAAQLGQAATGGSFNLRLITAKLFGFITYDRGTVTLTPLGARVVDEEKEKVARVESFLNIPLYKAVYDQFKGTMLPPNNGLESAMENLGVAPKQKDKARQVFQRSATQAGFFAYGNNRLVMPIIKGSTAPAVTPAEEEIKPDKKREKDEDERHPLIEGLIKTLPKAETEWTVEARKKWLQAASNIFDLIYTDSNGGSISVTVAKDSAKQ